MFSVNLFCLFKVSLVAQNFAISEHQGNQKIYQKCDSISACSPLTHMFWLRFLKPQ